MAKVKRKIKKYRVSSIKEFNEEPHMMQRNIASYNTEQMQVYGINVVLGRHVPMIIDGLKPVERRILYTLYRLIFDSEGFCSISIIGNIEDSSPWGYVGLQHAGAVRTAMGEYDLQYR